MLDQRQIDSLDESIPSEVVAKRESFDYLEGWYVINRANQIFGHGKWSTKVLSLDQVQTEKKPAKDGKNENHWIGYTCTAEVTLPDGASYQDIGFGQGIDRDLGKAHESATKEAVTDAVKRCLKNTGLSMGLALYDKKKAGVKKKGEAPKVETPLQAAKKKLRLDASECNVLVSQLMKAKGIGQPTATTAVTEAIITAANTGRDVRELLGLVESA